MKSQKHGTIRRCQELVDSYIAISILTLRATPDVRDHYTKLRADLPKMAISDLWRLETELGNVVYSDRQHFGINAAVAELRALVQMADARGARNLLLPKHVLMRWCTKIEAINGNWKDIFPTTRIALPSGLVQSSLSTGVELHDVHAMLYEDMCVTYNSALELAEACESPAVKKPVLKRFKAMLRSTIANAFYFVEAYLNSVGSYALHERKDLKPDEVRDLEEWNEAQQRPFYVKFRDKLIRYPRLAKGCQYAVLLETDCPELLFMVTRAKEYRDAIVHARPMRFDASEDGEQSKEHFVFNCSMGDVTEVVDNAVSLVRKIDLAVFEKAERTKWLIGRDNAGAFPDTAFT